jgi:hypothetical protein
MEEMNFRLWLEKSSTGSKGKLALYPPLYSGYMNYPPQVVVNWSADAITYMDDKDVQFHAYDDGKFHPYFWFDKVERLLKSGGPG